MLNYIWLSLIIIGILAAGGRDIYNDSQNTFRNGIPLTAAIDLRERPHAGEKISCTMLFSRAELREHFRIIDSSSFRNDVSVAVNATMLNDSTFVATLLLPTDVPDILKSISEGQGGKNTLTCRGQIARGDSSKSASATVLFDPIHYVFLKRITTSAFDAAGVAVQIAIGLIGIMALWLGVMKVAEESGLILILVKIVRPITVRLFPDVPPEHPAIGSILMNVSANMLGLGNAATPFGLKAMEELNKLNPHSGQATNAMVTFLAMNTSCITLIPATAIAVRASLGSADPASIIGPTLLASFVATVCAVTLSKLFQRLHFFRIRTEEK